MEYGWRERSIAPEQLYDLIFDPNEMCNLASDPSAASIMQEMRGRLDLSRWHPDFVPVSFYKMCGYPTGVGCLLVRKAMLPKLRRPWFAGGTISAATVQGDWYVMAQGEAAYGKIDVACNHLQATSIFPYATGSFLTI